MSNCQNKSTIKSMSKKKMFLTQIALLVVVALFLADRSMLVSWVRNFLNMLHLGDVEGVIAFIFAPCRAIFDSCQAIGLIYFLRFVFIISIASMIVVFCFQYVSNYNCSISNIHSVKTGTIIDNDQHIYKKQQRFLC